MSTRNTNAIPAPGGERLLSKAQVAIKLGCSQRNVMKLAAFGRMPACVRVGKLVRWRQEAIDQWISAGCPAGKE